MAVNLVISETLDGAQVADALAGGGTGLDLGQVQNGEWSPRVPPSSNNEGKQDLYIQHDAVVDPITDVKLFMQEFGVGTGFTYGGADSAAGDFTSLKNLADASGSSKNNADGLSGGLWVEFDADVSQVNQFDQATRPTLVKIFGDGLTDGIDLASAFQIPTDSMVYNAPPETLASAAVAGSIGKAGDTVLGDAAHIALRIYLPQSQTDGGIFQGELVTAYSFTA